LAGLVPWQTISQPFTNTVVLRENQKPGSGDWLLTNPALYHQIEGYATLTSVDRGGQINFLVNTTNSAYVLDVFRVGWYGGAGARQVFGPVTVQGSVQPAPGKDPVTGLVECNWTNPYTLNITASPNDPTDWASGVYLARLTGSDDGLQNYIIFAVRDDKRPTDLLVQLSFTTYEAYNSWGGNSLYGSTSRPSVKAKKISFNRPFALVEPYWWSFGRRYWNGSGNFFAALEAPGLAGWECNLVRWLEREGYDVSYCTSVDLHANTNLLNGHKAFISIGHDEYWSYPMRWNVQGARDRGVNLAFFGGGTCYWQVRFEPSTADGSPNRTIVCYKSTADPVFSTSSNYLATLQFRSAQLHDPESSLVGTAWDRYGLNTDIVVNDPTHWIFAKTGVQAGQRLVGLLGTEVDSTNRSSPATITVACRSPYLDPFATNPAPLLYSDVTSYSAPSGSTVFASGSMQWSWGLDDFNVPALRGSCQSPVVQQITRNIIARIRNAPTPSPTFLFRTDSAKAGNWKASYGSEGFVLPGDSTNLPAYAVLDTGRAPVTTYLLSSADPNSLQRSGSAGSYLAGWSDPARLTMDLNLSDTRSHMVALYFWDWNNAGRTQMVEVVDAATGKLLDRRTIGGFTRGQWWVWQVNGHVQFRITNVAGPDCLVNALAFGSGAQAQFLAEDAVTSGNWQSIYGAEGAYIAGNQAQPPAYGSVSIGNPALTTWSLGTTDSRAPVRCEGSNCVFAAWTASGFYENTFDILTTDDAWHQLALYCVDAEGLGRKQLVELLDPATSSVLDTRVLTNFASGKYLVWNIREPIQVRLLSLNWMHAAVSGIFFGPSNLSPGVSLTTPASLQTFTLPTNVVLAADARDPDGAVSQVSFFANGNWLTTVTNAPFVYVWTNPPVGHYALIATALDDRMAASASPPVTITVAVGSGYRAPKLQINSPANGSVWQAPTNVVIAATVTPISVPILSLQFVLDSSPLGLPLTTPPFTLTNANWLAGVHSLSAVVLDAFGVTTASPTNSVTILNSPSRAVFRGYDFAVEGSWQGFYGADGYSLMGGPTAFPPYVTVRPSGNSTVVWTSATLEPRALQNPNGTNRFAGAWYSFTNFVVDLNLLDGYAHRIALYCLDWNMNGGAQNIQVRDAATGAVLDSEYLAEYINGAYAVWDVAGHVQFSFSRRPPSLPSTVSGIFFDPPRVAPAVTLVSPPDGSRFAAPARIELRAPAARGLAPLSRVEFLANGTLLGADTSGPIFTFTWSNVPAGSFTLTARAVDIAGLNAVSAPVALSVELPATAIFAFSDTDRHGEWLGGYGQEGYLLAGDSTNLPAFATVGLGSQLISWTTDTSEPRALQQASGAGRVAAAWYAFTNLLVDVNFADDSFHRLEFYFLDWLNQGGAESVYVYDHASGTLLDYRVVPAFAGGTFLAWDLKRHVVFRLARAPWPPAPAMLSGLFFDPSFFFAPNPVFP